MNRLVGEIGFLKDIRPLFEPYASCMMGLFDLTDWDEVRHYSTQIRNRVVSVGDMPPPPNQFSAEERLLVDKWLQDDCPLLRGAAYADFFRDLDGWTEYWEFYHPETNGRYYSKSDQTGLLDALGSSIKLWRDYSGSEGTAAGTANLAKLRDELMKPEVKEAFMEYDSFLCGILRKHFEIEGKVNVEAYIDCVERFAKDTLAPDQERYNKIPEGSRLKTHSLLHTMDSAGAWFFWLGFCSCSALVMDDVEDDSNQQVRALMAAAAVAGVNFEFLFRPGRSGPVQPGYSPDEKTAHRLRQEARARAKNPAVAYREARAMYRIYRGL